MKRTIAIFAAIVSLAALSVLDAAAQGTKITKGLPAVTVMLGKNEVLTVDEFNAGIARIEKNWAAQINPSIGAADKDRARIELMAAVKPRLLGEQIDTMLFKQFCEREGVTVTDGDVTAYIATLKKQLGGQGESDAALEQYLLSAQDVVLDLRSYARQRLLIRKYIQTKRADEVKSLRGPTSEDILSAYQKMKDSRRLDVPESAQISLVYIDVKGKGADERKKALDLLKSLGSKSRDKAGFEKVVLGALEPDSGYMVKPVYVIPNVKGAPYNLDPKLLDAVFKLDPGEVSDVIQSEDRLQLVRMSERSPAKVLGLCDPIPGEGSTSVIELLAEQLVNMTQEAYASKVVSEVLAKVRGEATISIQKANLKGVIGDSELDAIASRYAKKK